MYSDQSSSEHKRTEESQSEKPFVERMNANIPKKEKKKTWLWYISKRILLRSDRACRQNFCFEPFCALNFFLFLTQLKTNRRPLHFLMSDVIVNGYKCLLKDLLVYLFFFFLIPNRYCMCLRTSSIPAGSWILLFSCFIWYRYSSSANLLESFQSLMPFAVLLSATPSEHN